MFWLVTKKFLPDLAPEIDVTKLVVFGFLLSHNRKTIEAGRRSRDVYSSRGLNIFPQALSGH